MASGSRNKHTNTVIADLGGVNGVSKERPWLLPTNRKLRALHGISLRNLVLNRQAAKPREEAIDDDSLPSALQTPEKALMCNASHKLQLSRSHEDLQGQSEVNGKHRRTDLDAPSPRRPTKAKNRRRSTLNWTSASPDVRQHKLESVTANRMADTWFSLHCKGKEEPIYVSEVIEKAMNPSFSFFDPNVYGPSITRKDELIVKFWAKTEGMREYALLINLTANLRYLRFLGTTLESFRYPLPENTVLFHLLDGIYTSLIDLPIKDIVKDAPISQQKKTHPLEPTSDFDSLMRLANLDDCIQDALATREKLSKQIELVVQDQHRSRDIHGKAAQAKERLAATNASVGSCRRQVKTAQTQRDELQARLEARRRAIKDGQAAQDTAAATLVSAQAALPAAVSNLKSIRESLSGQIRRICEDLLRIYPIESIDPKSLSYTIRGLHLPNANSSTPQPGSSPESTSAALGIVAHLTELLSHYLFIPLPYPPTPRGSTSTIYDPISNSMPSVAARTFPLFQKAAVAYRFEYGVFLLNTDIELLMSRQGARVVDLRHTLPNLNYVLMVLTAGKGELPTRKRGGVKALANGKPVGSSNAVGFAEAAEKGLQIAAMPTMERPV